MLCQRARKVDGSKRRRVEETDAIEDLEEVKPLQPLLLCLESALKADAHEGGDWTRGDDNQRYKMVSDPSWSIWQMSDIPLTQCQIANLPVL